MGKRGGRLSGGSAAVSTLCARASSPTAFRAASCQPRRASRWQAARRHHRRGISVVFSGMARSVRARSMKPQYRRAVAATVASWSCGATRGLRARRGAVNLAGSMADALRARSDYRCWEVDAPMSWSSANCPAERVGACPEHGGPSRMLIHTYRLCHHSKNNDNRPATEVAARRELEADRVVQGRKLDLTDADRTSIDAEVEAAIADVVAMARRSAVIVARALRAAPCGRPSRRDPAGRAARRGHRRPVRRRLQGDARVLRPTFPRACAAPPMSEGAIAGISGPASRSTGYRPIAEIMFGDFLR